MKYQKDKIRFLELMEKWKEVESDSKEEIEIENEMRKIVPRLYEEKKDEMNEWTLLTLEYVIRMEIQNDRTRTNQTIY